MRVRVVSVFGVANLQDEGRPGYRKFGVPPGGAFDRESFCAANALINNSPGAPCIEFALGTLELEALDDGAIAFVGATASVALNSVDQGGDVLLPVAEGDKLTVAPPKRGLRTYIALPGGVQCDLALGSASGTVVDRGDVLESVTDQLHAKKDHLASPPTSLAARALRFVPCADASWTSAEFSVGRSLDRVGLRLEGPKPMLDARAGTSEPSVFGAIQVTEDRTLIVHGPDGPTIGGYKKLGGIVRADLDRLGQLAPGDKVHFEVFSP